MVYSWPPDGIIALLFQGDAGFCEVDYKVPLYQLPGLCAGRLRSIVKLVAYRVDAPFYFNVLALSHAL